MTKHNRLSVLLLCTFLVKCLLACFTELNNDEVYYWTYAQHLQWSYFDHPPGIAIILKIFTLDLSFQDEFFLRQGPIICSAISTWLIYLSGKAIKDETTGWISAIFFTASPYCSVIAGLLVIPDAPMLLFWLWSILLMIRICMEEVLRQRTQLRLLLLGFSIGGCILCKVHGIFLWAGFGMYILFLRRSLLRNPFLYLAFLITALMIAPIFYWNISNQFISYTYHSDRVSFFSHIQWDSFFRELSGEAMYNNPIVFVLMAMMITAVIKKKSFLALPTRNLLLCLSLPLIATVVFLSVFRDTLPHWSGPAYTTLIPLTAAWLHTRQKEIKLPPVAKWALGFTTVLLVIAGAAVKWWPTRIGSSDQQHLGSGDVTLDMNGWKNFGSQFDSLYHSDTKQGIMRNDAFLTADYWFPAAHIDYYAARKTGINFIAVGGLKAIHHYAWLNAERPSLKQGDDVYFVTVSNFFNKPSPSLTSCFTNVLPPATITQYRNGIAVRNFFIYRMKKYKGGIPVNGVLVGQ